MKKLLIAFGITAFIFGCKENTTTTTQQNSEIEYYQSDFFKEVQLSSIYKDSKTFVDMTPKKSRTEILDLYQEAKKAKDFNLKTFVETYFDAPESPSSTFITDTSKTMYQHISSMWPVLTRNADVKDQYSSKIALPHPYIVPGGRFREVYYWDSYFTMIGLLADNQDEMAKNMVDNFSFLIDTLGFIPNGNRDYYNTRSQPPFYTLMVTALAKNDTALRNSYLPYIEKEYEYWMQGSENLTVNNTAVLRVFKTKNGLLNRYFDTGNTPRQESYKEDYELAQQFKSVKEQENLYSNMRSGAASGWDFSSRWYAKENDFSSTNTTQIAPVDLNCLLFYVEKTLATIYESKGNLTKAKHYQKRATERKTNIQELFYNTDVKFFTDVNIHNQQSTTQYTLAAVYPLFFKVATPTQASEVKNRIMTQFLYPGGLVTTLQNTGQQWDAPNGWAPLQYMTVKGLLNYGYTKEAETIMNRWLAVNEKVYQNTGKMMEKYNVQDTTLLSGGGEYDLQDGFGWTNGVALGFKKLKDSLSIK